MKDLTPGWIKVKAALFLMILEHPTWKVGLLLALVIWCFCRLYYFAFYVIEHYVDPGYKFSGLWSFVSYLVRKRKPDDRSKENPSLK
jgi:hypothetical protein